MKRSYARLYRRKTPTSAEASFLKREGKNENKRTKERTNKQINQHIKRKNKTKKQIPGKKIGFFFLLCRYAFSNAWQMWVAAIIVSPAMTYAEATSPHTIDTPFLMGVGGLLLLAITHFHVTVT